MQRVVIHTDGSCWPNPGPGGWGAVLTFPCGVRQELSGREGATTNNRMEMLAAIMALDSLEAAHSVELYTDSEYLQKGASLWLPKWERKGFKGVKNADLWRLIAARRWKHDIRWHWVRGHDTCAENNRCDALAENARTRNRDLTRNIQ